MGISQWLASFLIRSHQMTPLEVGTWLALSFGVFGTLGNYLGGFFASRYAACQEKLQMRVVAWINVCYALTSLAAYLTTNKNIALTLIAVTAIAGAFGNGPVFGAMQSLVNEKMRSVAVAMTFMLANLIGFGLGPLALGAMSDWLNPVYGNDSLRYALAAFSPGMLWVAFYYWKAGRTIQEDISNAEQNGSMQRVATA